MEKIEVSPLSILYEQMESLITGTIAILPSLAVATIVLILTFIAAKVAKAIVNRILRPSKMRPSLKKLLRMLFGIGVWALGLMIAAVIVFPNLTPASMLAGLGLGSVAIGFAFKDTFENFLSGIIILLREEMRIGDHIETQDIEGKVENISLRESHIRQTDGQLIIVPNSILFKNPLKIVTDLDQRRTTIICGVGYDEDIAKSQDVIQKAVESCETVIQNGREIQIFANELGSSSVNFEVTWWTGSQPVDIRRSRDEVIFAIKSALDAAGIEIPFPHRSLTFKEPLVLGHTPKDENA